MTDQALYNDEMTPFDPDLTPVQPSVETEQPLPAASFQVRLSFETLLYIGFVAVAIALRLLELGTVVLSDPEAREALAVLRTMGDTSAHAPISSHPLMFAANSLLMSILGTQNGVPRLATAALGVVIVLMPLLYRRWLGRMPALAISGLLAISPVLLTASRTMSGSVWSIALALLAVWLAGRFLETHERHYAWAATSALALLVVGSEGPGFLVAIMLAVGLIFALVTVDDPDHTISRRARETLTDWPWVSSLIAAAITLFLVGTVFFLKIEGAAGFGEVLSNGALGFAYRQPYNPVAFPLYTSLIYEPLFWIFGLAGAWITLRDFGGFLPRALIGWLVAAVIICLIYPGALAEHALWMTIPLAGLAGVALERVFEPVRDAFWNPPFWAPYLHAVAVVAVLCIAGINLVVIGKNSLNLTPTLVPQTDTSRYLLTGLTAALLVILYFLIGSVWGAKTAWRGLAIGVLVFLGVYSLSSGWRASVTGASDPREPWRPRPTAQNLIRLEKDLREVSLRASGMPYDMPVAVASADDGAVAWVLRNFSKVTYVQGASPAFNGPAILLPRTVGNPKDEKPALGADYVGTDYPVNYTFDRATIQYWDVLAWLYERDTRQPPTSGDRIALWVRADIYGATPVEALDPAAK